MITVKDVLSLAIETDMQLFAHHIFWAISTHQIAPNDDSNKLLTLNHDAENVRKMSTANPLEIGKVKLYAVETRQPNYFAFYYSENILEVDQLHRKLFRETPKRLTNASRLLREVFHFADGRDASLLYFHRSQVVEFPYYLGHIWGGEAVLERLDGFE